MNLDNRVDNKHDLTEATLSNLLDVVRVNDVNNQIAPTKYILPPEAREHLSSMGYKTDMEIARYLNSLCGIR